MKLSKQQIELIKKLSNEKVSYVEIAKKLNIAPNTVAYWAWSRESRIEYQKNRLKKLSKEKKKEIYKKQYPYRKKYFMDRYNNDEEFRNKVKERARNYQKRRRGK